MSVINRTPIVLLYHNLDNQPYGYDTSNHYHNGDRGPSWNNGHHGFHVHHDHHHGHHSGNHHEHGHHHSANHGNRGGSKGHGGRRR